MCVEMFAHQVPLLASCNCFNCALFVVSGVSLEASRAVFQPIWTRRVCSNAASLLCSPAHYRLLFCTMPLTFQVKRICRASKCIMLSIPFSFIYQIIFQDTLEFDPQMQTESVPHDTAMTDGGEKVFYLDLAVLEERCAWPARN